MYFDRVLADVPCSGDGTMRKNPSIWNKWGVGDGIGLHKLQLDILMRGLSMLKQGGRLVYSTCSLNPAEDEAVLAEALRRHAGKVKLVEIKHQLTGLRFINGMSKWHVMNKQKQWVTRGEDEKLAASLFEPTDDEAAWMNLDCSVRVLPHLQNTGGFFIAAFESTAPAADVQEQESEKAVVLKPKLVMKKGGKVQQ